MYEFDTNKSCLKQISLSNAESKSIWDLSDKYGVSIDTIRGAEDYLYFDVCWYEDEEKTNFQTGLYRYNLKEAHIEKMVDSFICNGFQLINEDCIFYMDLHYNMKMLTLSTNKETLVRSTDGNFGAFSYDGQYLYYYGLNADCIEVYNLKGKKIEEIPFPYIECYFGDMQYLFADGYTRDSENEEEEMPILAYFDKSQIGTKTSEWKCIKE